jgi:hypothetical protein
MLGAETGRIMVPGQCGQKKFVGPHLNVEKVVHSDAHLDSNTGSIK